MVEEDMATMALFITLIASDVHVHLWSFLEIGATMMLR